MSSFSGSRFVIGIIAIAAVMAGLFSTGTNASEAQTTFTVNSTADPGDGVCNPTECTLREAIDAANAAPGLDVINFDPGVFPEGSPAIIAVVSQLPNIAEALIIDSTGAGVVLEPAVPVAIGLFVQETDPVADTDFTLIGNDSFTVRGFDEFGIFVCGWDGVSPAGCGTGPVSNVLITGSTLSAGHVGVQVAADTNIGVSIDGNVAISGGAEGVAIGGSSSNVSLSDNGPISGTTVIGVRLDGRAISNIAIERNDSIGGGIGIFSEEGIVSDLADISISNNGPIIGLSGEVHTDGVHIGKGNLSNISITGNASLVGRSGVNIFSADDPHGAPYIHTIKVAHNGLISGDLASGIVIVEAI